MQKTVMWFSAGGSSAMAAKLLQDAIDEIIYIHIDDQEDDTLRFVDDVSRWLGKPITILQSPFKSVESVCRSKRYINGPKGAACTMQLKKLVRTRWEYEQPLGADITYIWGMDSSEKDRANRLVQTMPHFNHRFPLIEQGYTKELVHQVLSAYGIKRPRMYDMGYRNNNCVGCVKGGMAYWNKVRVDFPEVFSSRAKMERDIGRSCIKGIFFRRARPN